MKRLLVWMLMGMVAVPLFSQSVVQLTWTASTSECESSCAAGTAPTLINVYRATTTNGSCSGMTWTQIATAQPPAGPYTDSTVAPGGRYCYEVRGYFKSEGPTLESGGSNWALVVIPVARPSAPAGLTGVELSQ